MVHRQYILDLWLAWFDLAWLGLNEVTNPATLGLYQLRLSHVVPQLRMDWTQWTDALLTFFVTDHLGHHSMSWNNTPVLPISSEGFIWPSPSSKTVLPSSTKSSTLIVPLTQPSLTPTKTGSRTFPTVSFPTTKELIIAATYSSDFPRHTLLESHSAVYTSSVADLTSNQVRQMATDVNQNPTATKLPTGKNTYDS